MLDHWLVQQKILAEVLYKINDDKIKSRGDNMKNLWPLIAEQRGVEIGEEFEFRCHKCKINGDSLCYFSSVPNAWVAADYSFFNSFICGQGVIKKLPRPYETGDDYWYITTDGTAVYDCWVGMKSSDDVARAYMGNRFRTESEALEHKQEILDKYGEALK